MNSGLAQRPRRHSCHLSYWSHPCSAVPGGFADDLVQFARLYAASEIKPSTPSKAIPVNEKIAEDASRWQMDEASARRFAKTDWVVTEKVHGANFCFITDGVTVRCAKRKRFLKQGESFFHYEHVLNRVQEKIKAAFFLAGAHHPVTKWVMIYGELFGGGYPHPDIKADSSVQLVQTGVYYSPTIDFYAFDIALDRNPEGFGRSSRVFRRFELEIERPRCRRLG